MRLTFTLLIFLLFSLATMAQSKKKPNIINYFASNNQIIGVPMVDLDNEFRFYPDLSFQNAIEGVEVYYFVLNDVYKHHLVKRQDGRYWECTLREFSLGEAIQRVEVIVDCSRMKLIRNLKSFGIDVKNDNKAFQYLLMLRRGDDKNLYKLEFYNDLKLFNQSTGAEAERKFQEIKKLEEDIITNLGELLKNARTEVPVVDKDLPTRLEIERMIDKIDTAFASPEKRKELAVWKESLKILLSKNLLDDATRTKLLTALAKYQISRKDISGVATDLESYKKLFERFSFSGTRLPDDLFKENDFELLKSISTSSDANSRLYSAYVENRLASMLDMRYKDTDTSMVQFNYRNDKLSLQYLQADDPQERLGIFRARLVPFAFYANPDASATDREFKWQRGALIYEIGINFGYTVVKDDHFTPKLFDMNRLGLGIGVTADTFTDNPTFLSVSLTYDMNTYTSIGFGANLIKTPGFFMSIGINARAFKDLVKNSGALFKN